MQQREATPAQPALDTKISPTGPSDAMREAAALAEQAAKDASDAAAAEADAAHWEAVRAEALRKQRRPAPPPPRASYCSC